MTRALNPNDCCTDPRHDVPCFPICAECEAGCDPQFREPTTDVTARQAVGA